MKASRITRVWVALLLTLSTRGLQAQRSPGWRTLETPFSQFDWIEPDPFDSDVIYAAASDPPTEQSALFRSDDRGLAWILLSTPLPGDSVSTIQVDPRTRRLFATTCRPENDSFVTRIYVSSDSGASWDFEGDFASACGGRFEFDTRVPDTVYAVLGDSLYISEDSGSTWELRGPSFRLLQSGPIGLLYAVDDRGIIRSADGGLTWALLATPPPLCPWILAFAIEPEPLGPLVVGAGAFRFHTLDCGGVFRSVDGGRFWTDTLPQVPATDFVVDPEEPSRIYASSPAYSFGAFGAIGGVFQSIDSGSHWQSLGIPLGGADTLRLSASGQTLYAKNGGAVYAFDLSLTRVVPPRNTRTLPPR